MNRRSPPKDGKATSEQDFEQKPERLQKIMATAGLGSRRALERRIRNGEVRINDAVAILGQVAKSGDLSIARSPTHPIASLQKVTCQVSTILTRDATD